MISLQPLKKNFSLIGKGFYYFRVIKCVLDIPSPKTTSLDYVSYVIVSVNSTVVKLCSLYQAKVL